MDGFFEGSERVCGDPDQWGLYLEHRLSMGITAENVARKHNISREAQDQFAFESHYKAAKAIKEGKFSKQIVAIEVPQRKKEPIVFDTDEGVRPDTSVEKLLKLSPAFIKGGTVTAGNSSPLNDGASCVLMMTGEKAGELGLKPRLKAGPYISVVVHPAYMGLGPVSAIEKLLERTGLNYDDLDLIELNEAFAAQSLGVIKELDFTKSKQNAPFFKTGMNARN